MRKLRGVLAVLYAAMILPVQAQGVPSFFPGTGLARFIADNLDLASFPSALGPRLRPDRHTFATMNIHIEDGATEDHVNLSDTDGLSISISIVERGDFNHDGLEDVVICESEHADYGQLDATTPILLTRYGVNMPVVALAREPHLAPGVCDWSPAKGER